MKYNKLGYPYWIGAKKKGFVYLILAGIFYDRTADPDFEGIVKVMNVISGKVYDVAFEDYQKAKGDVGNLSGNVNASLRGNAGDYETEIKHLDKDFKIAWNDCKWGDDNFDKLVEKKLQMKRDEWIPNKIEGSLVSDTSDEGIGRVIHEHDKITEYFTGKKVDFFLEF